MNQEKFAERKKKIYGLICDDLYVPMKIKEMAILLDLPKEQRSELEEVLDALVAEGKVEISKKGKYSKAVKQLIAGRFVANARGFGFVEPEEGDDIFIAKEEIHGAMHGDQVLAALQPQQSGRRREGSIVRITERAVTRLVGSFGKIRASALCGRTIKGSGPTFSSPRAVSGAPCPVIRWSWRLPITERETRNRKAG